MFQQVFANYFKIAESAIQFQHELLREWSSQWPTAPCADGHTEQVRAVQKTASEDSSEMLNLQRKLLAMMTKPENSLIEDVPRMAKAAALAGRRGDVDAQTSVDREESAVLHQAYLKWLEEGCPEGQDRRHYFEALKQAR